MSQDRISGQWLTRVRLHGWNRFTDFECPIPFGSALHLGGGTGTGKTSILDAILWTLVGDETMIRFNVEAGGRRTLRDYVGCYVDSEKGYLRAQGIAHTLLEFTHAKTGAQTTIGSMIVHGKKDDPLTKAFFITELPATPDLLMKQTGQGYIHCTLDELRERARQYRSEGVYFHVIRRANEYRDRMAQRLGGLPALFFGALSHITGQDYTSVDLDVLIREALLGSKPVSRQPFLDSVTATWHNAAKQDTEGLLQYFLATVLTEHEEIKAVLDDVNRMIRRIQFGPWRCRFALSPVSSYTLPLIDDLMEVVDDYEQFRGDRTIRDDWAALCSKHRVTLDRLARALTADVASLSRKKRIQQSLLMTPSCHFAYDLELYTDNADEWASVAPLIGWINDRERQMFVQVVLVAALLRVYEDHPSRPRLALIPEGLSRIPDVLAAVLRLMNELGLQPIATAPVGACDIEKVMDYTVRLYRQPNGAPRYIQVQRALSPGHLAFQQLPPVPI
jgi:hypothetical protein